MEKRIGGGVERMSDVVRYLPGLNHRSALSRANSRLE